MLTVRSDLAVFVDGFDAHEYECRRCGEPIEHPGACDQCISEWESDIKPMREKLKVANVPIEKRDWTPRGIRGGDGESRKLLRDWRGLPQIVTIYGPSDSGKTGAAIIVLRFWLEHNKQARFVYLPDWLKEIAWLEREGSARHQFEAIAASSGLMLLDDFGTDYDTKFAIETMLRIVNRRESDRHPTIITTNKTIDQGANSIASLSERLATRIKRGLVIHWTK